MSEPFLAQIVMFAGNFAPRGWALCDGQLLKISQYTAVFSLLGTTYGGDGRSTFGLPDLRGRVAMHPGGGPGLSQRRLGEKGGVENVTLTNAEIPAHAHSLQGKNGAGDETNPAPGSFVASSSHDLYAKNAGVQMGPTAITGGGQAHTNVQPFLGVNFIIALQGVFPSRN